MVSFLTPLFLAGLAAAAVPIVIHLIHRRRARELPIATLRFLRMIPARTIRRRRIEEYILLATRVALFSLLALAAARPVLTEAEAAGGATSAAVVLDDSWSMDYRVSGITRFQEAVEGVLAVLGTLEEGDRAALIPASDPGGETLTSDLSGLRRRAGTARPSLLAGTSRGGKYPGLLPACAKAMALLRAADEPNRELVVVTDLQERALAPVLKELKEEDGDEEINVVVIDVGVADPQNLGISRVTAGVGMAVAGEPIRVTAALVNHGSAGAGARVSLLVGDERLGEREASVGAGESATVGFKTATDLPAAAGGSVRLSGDALLTDDVRHFALPVVGRIPVLLVNGDPSPIAFQDEAFFLRAALSPEDLGAEKVRSPVSLKTVEPDALPDEDLGRYRVVILANVAEIPPRAVSPLVSHVRSGGGLLVFCGSAVRPDSYNRDLGTDPEHGLLPAVLAAPGQLGEGEDDVIRLAEADTDHPLLADLPPQAIEDLKRIHVRRSMGADVRAAGGRVILGLDGGIPLLVEKQAGRGRVLLCTSSVDADWGNLPIRPVFLPLIHRAVRLLAGGGEESRDLLVGDHVAVPAPPPEAPPPELTDPGGEVRRLVGETDAEGALTAGPLLEPGVYRVTGSGAGEEIVFAVNVDPREGDLARVPPDLLTERFGEGRLRLLTGAKALGPELKRSRKGRPLWGWLLALALLTLLFEAFFANRIAVARAAREEAAA